MPKLSMYSNDIYRGDEGETMPWEFWTDEEKSLVIQNGYRRLILTSKDIRSYLNTTRAHFYTQWLGPISAFAFSNVVLRTTVFSSAYKKHPMIGHRYQAAFLGVFTCLWLNLNPYYIKKEDEQDKLLTTLYTRVGPGITLYNDLVARFTTSSSIDKDTWTLYNQRNGSLAGTIYAEEDSAPPILRSTPAIQNIRKIYS